MELQCADQQARAGRVCASNAVIGISRAGGGHLERTSKLFRPFLLTIHTVVAGTSSCFNQPLVRDLDSLDRAKS